jgi:hypothetical protein
MRPLAFVLGVVAGSAVAIAVCLAMVLVVFLLLRSEHPQFGEELPVLARFTALFTVLAGIGLVSMVAQLRLKYWRWWAIGALALWSVVVIIAARAWLSGAR